MSKLKKLNVGVSGLTVSPAGGCVCANVCLSGETHVKNDSIKLSTKLSVNRTVSPYGGTTDK